MKQQALLFPFLKKKKTKNKVQIQQQARSKCWLDDMLLSKTRKESNVAEKERRLSVKQ